MVTLKHFGVGAYTWPWAARAKKLTALEIARRAQAAGLDTIQLCDNIPLFELTESELATLKAAGLRVELGVRGLANVPKALALAKKLDAPLLRLAIDTHDHEPEPQEIIAALQELLPVLEEQGCTLALENHGRLSARALAWIIYTLESPLVGICLDTANSMGAGEDLQTVLDHLAPLTLCLHLKDVTIQPVGHLMGFDIRGCEPGTGLVDFATTLERMGDRCQSVILEQWPPEPSVEEDWAQLGIQRLKESQARRL